ncbi:PAS domain S-box protein [Sphingomonas sp. 22L2VL55-3]
MTDLSAYETQRLAALAHYDVMDTPREAAFDEVVELVAAICEAPIAIVNLIEDGRQFFKAEVGLGVRETPLDTSFCGQAILQEDFLLVPDATGDPRFNCNPSVTGEPHLRFYAGAVLKSPDGFPIGTLCVLDHRPRDLTDVQKRTIRIMAKQVMVQLEQRLTTGRLAASEARQRAIVDSAEDFAIVACDLEGRIVEWSYGAERVLGWSEKEAIGESVFLFFTDEDRVNGVPAQEMKTAREGGLPSMNVGTCVRAANAFGPVASYHCSAIPPAVTLATSKSFATAPKNTLPERPSKRPSSVSGQSSTPSRQHSPSWK